MLVYISTWLSNRNGFNVLNSLLDAVKPQPIPPANQFPEQPIHPQMSEAEFEEIMTRNRTVSSSAIARAVSDAAAGETMR